MIGCRCIELDTPQTILDEGNSYYEVGTDIFEEVLSESGAAFSNGHLMMRALWWRYRMEIIGSCNTPEWVRGMADRLLLIGSKWDEVLSKAQDPNVDMTSITDRGYTRIYKRTGTDTNVNTPEGEDVTVNEHESLPQTATGSTRYLDSRDTATSKPKVVTTDKLTHDTTDEETFSADDTITAKTFSDMMSSYPQILSDFADEFTDHFMNRWYQ